MKFDLNKTFTSPSGMKLSLGNDDGGDTPLATILVRVLEAPALDERHQQRILTPADVMERVKLWAKIDKAVDDLVELDCDDLAKLRPLLTAALAPAATMPILRYLEVGEPAQ